MSDELLGKQIGGYEILNRIGRGGMATVYCARQNSMNRLVAIKVLPRELMNDDTYLQRFEREARIVSQLEHRNIVPVYDYGQYENQPYIVMRYMNAGSVDDLLAKGPLQVEQALDILEQIAPALDYAHGRGILHRDLKPSNILMDDDGGAFVTDFGIARILNTEGQGNTITTQGVVGTPAYMSPEQAQGHTLDSRSDLYSMGVMLFEMSTGRRPFHSDTPYSIAVMQVTAAPPSARAINPAVTPAVEQVIYKTMRKKPQERYHTAAELVEALRMAIERPGDSKLHDTQPRRPDAAQVTQPTPVPQYLQAAAQQPAPLQQAPVLSPYATPPASYMPPPTPTYSGEVRQVRPRLPRRRNNPMWWGIILGAMIGCVLLAAVVIALALMADQLINSSAGVGTPSGEAAARILGMLPDDGQALTLAASDGSTDISKQSEQAALNPATPSPQPSARGTSTPAPIGMRQAAFDSRIVYFAKREGNFELFRLNLLTDYEIQLTADNAANQFPAVSPDSSRVAFQSDRDGDFDIYSVNESGGNLVQVVQNNVDDVLPSWSGDGEWLAFASDARGDGNYDLFIARPDGSDLQRVLTNGRRNNHPRWSPDGHSLVFTTGQRQDARTWEIAILDLDTREVRMLTDDTVRDAWPIFSLDGKDIYYVSGSDTRHAIVRQNASGSGSAEILTSTSAFVWGLNLSFDGMYLAYNAGPPEDAAGTLYMMRVDGSDQREVTAARDAIYASWSP